MFLLSNIASISQTPYQKIDSLSKAIRTIQEQVNDKLYQVSSSEVYTLSFPEESFGINISDKLAHVAVYKTRNDKDVLYLTNSIDITKLVSVKVITDESVVGRLLLEFPQANLKTQTISNGKTIQSTSEYLELFFLNTIENRSKPRIDQNQYLLINLLAALTNNLKSDRDKAQSQKDFLATESWNRLLRNTTSLLSLERFVSDYPTSIFVKEIKQEITAIKEEEALKREKEAAILKKATDYLKGFMEKYKFKAGLTESEFREYNPEASLLVGKKKSVNKYSRTETYSGKDGTFIWLDNNGRVTNYYRILIRGKKMTVSINALYEEMKQQFIQNIPGLYLRVISQDETEEIVVILPGSDTMIILKKLVTSLKGFVLDLSLEFDTRDEIKKFLIRYPTLK